MSTHAVHLCVLERVYERSLAPTHTDRYENERGNSVTGTRSTVFDDVSAFAIVE